MKLNKEHLAAYLEHKKYSWADSTKISARARLGKLLPILDADPITLWKYMDDIQMKPYSRSTTWIQVIGFIDYLITTKAVDGLAGKNNYTIFKHEKSRYFKHAYERVEVNVSFEEAKARLMSITNEAIRTKALSLLYTGMRYTESKTLDDKGYIIGKGGKRRKVYGPLQKLTGVCSYDMLYRNLKKLQLTPHKLRKLAATKFAEAGMKEADLLKVFGWSSMETASKYLQPKRDCELSELINGAI